MKQYLVIGLGAFVLAIFVGGHIGLAGYVALGVIGAVVWGVVASRKRG